MDVFDVVDDKVFFIPVYRPPLSIHYTVGGYDMSSKDVLPFVPDLLATFRPMSLFDWYMLLVSWFFTCIMALPKIIPNAMVQIQLMELRP